MLSGTRPRDVAFTSVCCLTIERTKGGPFSVSWWEFFLHIYGFCGGVLCSLILVVCMCRYLTNVFLGGGTPFVICCALDDYVPVAMCSQIPTMAHGFNDTRRAVHCCLSPLITFVCHCYDRHQFSHIALPQCALAIAVSCC